MSYAAEPEQYFMETSKSTQWVPRAILTDLEPGTMDVIRGIDLNRIFENVNLTLNHFIPKNSVRIPDSRHGLYSKLLLT